MGIKLTDGENIQETTLHYLEKDEPSKRKTGRGQESERDLVAAE